MDFSYNNNNVFAKILKGELPSDKIFEDEFCLAFHNIAPEYDVHALVIPKNPYVNYAHFIQNASSSEIVGFFKAIDLVSEQLGISDSYRLITNYGAKSGQEVFHFHVHLVRNK